MLTLVVLLSVNGINAQNQYLSFTDKTLKQKESENSFPTRVVNLAKPSTVELQYTFTGAFISEKTVNAERYNFIHIDGFSKMGQVGAPALPARNEVVALPRGSEASIEIINADYTEFEGYYVHPALEPAIDTEGAESPKFVRDEAIFSKNAWFPQSNVEIASVGLSRGTPLAVVQVTPVQFNPATRKIRVCTNIEFSITPVGGEANFDYISRENSITYTNNLKKAVINSASIPDGISENTTPAMPTESATPKNYIIITHSEYLDEAMRLANWKRQLGYTVEVVSRSSWTAEEVKTEVHDRYSAWTPKPDYMLIIGDHTGDYAVPGEIHQDPSYGDNFATDTYVVCMDGSSDHVPDMGKGRIAVSSLAEATIVIDKIINYEKTPPTSSSFYENALNCAQYQDTDNNDGYADRRFCHTSEDIRDYLQDEQGYTSTRVYYRNTNSGCAGVDTLRYNNGYFSDGQLLPAELRSPSFNWSGGSSDITTEIDAGKFLVFHRDHGYVGGSGWAHPYYTTSTMTNLSNGDLLPVVFSMNCHTGEFQLSNCFAEKFLRMENKGAVGVVAAAYYSYSGYNDALSIGMIDAIWPDPGLYPDFGTAGNGGTYTMGGTEGIYTLGDVVNQGLYAMTQNYWNNTYTFELFHYFGDPAMKIWTANPNDTIIAATHGSTIDCTQSTFAVSGSHPYATATLVCNNSLIGKTTLDASGNGNIPYALTTSGDVTLTVSKHNCVPYTGTLTQTCTNFPPEVNLIEATNEGRYSATIGGIIIDDFGNTVNESGVLYSTNPDFDFNLPGTVQLETSPVTTIDSFLFDLTGLTASTTYYYMAYAINAVDTGLTSVGTFTTDNDIIFGKLVCENFENGGIIPDGWTQEQVNSSGIDWMFITGNGDSNPATAHSGTYNACLRDINTAENKTRLISPGFDLSNWNDVTLSFWHTQALWSPDQDELTVYYRTSASGSWTELATYTSDIPTWTEETITLPETSADFYLCFEGNAKYGYGVCIDDVAFKTSGPVAMTDSLALVALYNATNGANWTNNTNWLTGPVNTWHGITVESGRVTEIDLYFNNLNGALPIEIYFIDQLENLSLGQNSITGELSPLIGKLEQLNILDFNYNDLTGIIPDELIYLTSLSTLNLRYNSFDIDGYPEHINQMTSLNTLYLCGCNITELPASLANLTNLRRFWCENNSISGTIPDFINQLTNLTSLNLNGNNLEGGLDNLENLTSLSDLILSYNNLSGEIPAWIGSFGNLLWLSLNYNSFSGLLPEEFSNLSKLSWCNLNNNQLRGDLPSSLSESFSQKTTSNDGDLSLPAMQNIQFVEKDGRIITFYNDEQAEALGSLSTFNVENNHFSFANLAASGITPGSIGTFTYSPQDTVFSIEQNGGTLTALDGNEPNNQYTWFKNGMPIPTSNRSIDITESGTYRFEVTNTVYTGMTLSSDSMWYEAPIVPVNNQVSNTILGDGDSDCYNAQNILTVAGDETDVILQNGSATTFIAAYSIRFLPGFHAQNGSYIDAHITTNSSFCDNLPEQVIVEYTAPETYKSERTEQEKIAHNDFIAVPLMIVYPNPTTGIVNVEWKGFEEPVQITLFNAIGTKIVQKTLHNETRANVNLSNHRKGIYFVKIQNSHSQQIQKILLF